MRLTFCSTSSDVNCCIDTLGCLVTYRSTRRPGASEPLYRQILEQVPRLISDLQVAAGDALPSVREVAAFHAIDPMTAARA